MNIVPIQNVAFDDEATLVMGAVFDQACNSLRDFGRGIEVRDIIAKRIIEAAKNGERDPAQIYQKALRAFSIDEMSMPIAGGDRDFPIPIYALVARTA
jgi:hypothetical protein